jgi:hypothetical protein
MPQAGAPITILIPTRERADVLPYALATCTAQKDPDLRILVSDNASTDGTPALVAAAAAADPRVRSIRAPHRLGMSEHWEFALSHVTEGWVAVLGDDDGLMPGAVPSLRAALERHPDLEAISWPYSFYCYPDPSRPEASGLLALGQEPAEEVRDGLLWLGKLADFRSAYYTELPMAYHGLVHTALLARIRARQPEGRLIGTRIPDVFLAVALAATCGRYLRMTTSQSLYGSSPHSNGSSSQGVGDQGIYARFERESAMGTHPRVPPMRAISTLILEALFSCRDAGLVPASTAIDVETAFTRAYLENAALPCPDPDDTVARLAAGTGQERTRDSLAALPPEERAALAVRLALSGWNPVHARVANILDEHGVRDVAGAVKIAAATYGVSANPRATWFGRVADKIGAAVRRLSGEA